MNFIQNNKKKHAIVSTTFLKIEFDSLNNPYLPKTAKHLKSNPDPLNGKDTDKKRQTSTKGRGRVEKDEQLK